MSGVVSRGVLVDVPRHLGVDYLVPGTRITPDILDAVLDEARITLSEGDILLLRTVPILNIGAVRMSDSADRRGSRGSAPGGSATAESRPCAQTTWPSRYSARTPMGR